MPLKCPSKWRAEADTPRARPMFSVLIATYNQADFIAETLDSVAAQSCTDFEIVVVDDGSTDGTPEVVAGWIERFRQQHPNHVIVTRIANSGQSAAIEHGFACCSGRYICLLDSDDRWLPHKLQEVARVASEHPEAGMIAHPLLVIDPQGNRTGDVRPKRARLPEGDLREQVRRTGRLVGSANSAIILEAELFRRLLPMPTKRFRACADYYLCLAASLARPVAALQEPLAEYRLHPGGHHIRSLLSVDGLQMWADLQRVVARHLRIEGALRRDSFYTRHAFAISKLQGGLGAQVRAYRDLLHATAIDRGFEVRDRVLLAAYWTLCMLSPRALFARLWQSFQLRGTRGITLLGAEGA